MALTQEQFTKARKAGFSTEKIIEFEKRRPATLTHQGLPQEIMTPQTHRREFLRRALPEAPGFLGQAIGGGAGYLAGGVPGGILGGTAGRFGGELVEAKGRQLAESLRGRDVPGIGKQLAETSFPPLAIARTLQRATPQERREIYGGTALAAPVEAIGGGIAKGVTRIPGLIRAFGGVYPETVTQSVRIGMKKIADPAKRAAGYFTDTLVPRAVSSVNKMFAKITPKSKALLSQLGASQETVNNLSRYGRVALENTYRKYGGSLGRLVERPIQGLTSMLDDVGKRFDIAFQKSALNNFSIKNTFFKLQNTLKSIGAIGEDGIRLAGRYGNKTIDSLVDIYDSMRLSRTASLTATGRQGAVSDMINKPLYNRIKLQIQGALSGNNEVDRFAYSVLSSLREDASKAVPALKNLYSQWGKINSVKDIYSKKLTEGVFKRKSLDLSTRKALQEIDNILPSSYKFYDDLFKFRSASEFIDVFNKNLSPQALEKHIAQMSNYKKPDMFNMRQTQQIFKHFGDKEILDDALAHFLGKDLYQEILQTGFLGVAGATRKGAENLVRFGIRYKTILDQITKPTRFITRPLRAGIGRLIPTAITEELGREQ